MREPDLCLLTQDSPFSIIVRENPQENHRTQSTREQEIANPTWINPKNFRTIGLANIKYGARSIEYKSTKIMDDYRMDLAALDEQNA